MPNKEDYLKLLEKDAGGTTSRLTYLAEKIFEFSTDDPAMSVLFATKALEICEALTHRTTVAYIEDQENYRWFLLMMHIPFFAEKTDCGVSIRSSWWSPSIITETFSLPFFGLEIKEDEWDDFVLAMAEFAQEELHEQAS